MNERRLDVDAAIERARRFFTVNQNADGHWRGELEGGALTLSETILLLAFLGEEDSRLAKECAQTLVATQLPQGGWEKYPGAGPNVIDVVKGYFALKLVGEDPTSEPLVRARKTALELGGADAVDSFTRFYLAILGQIPFSQTPAIPPQITLFPRWFPLNIYSASSWSRTIFVPLSIVSALQPIREIPAEKGIRELFLESPEHWKPLVCPGKKRSNNPFSWEFFFRRVDRAIWRSRRLGLTPFRQKAVREALRWTLERFERSDGPGAIYPPIVWSWIALKALGFADDSSEIAECRRQLEALVVRDAETGLVRVQPCRSPVWDSTLTLKSLLATGLNEDSSIVRRGLDWVRGRQIDRPGDWSQKVAARPGGWAFEYANDFYPDNDDAAMALTVLGGAFPENDARPTPKAIDDDENLRRGVDWLFAMQNKDGGWGAFDKGNDRKILCKVPFADHNAMIDPSCVDLTGRVLEAFGRLGFRLTPETNSFLKANKNKQKSNLNAAWSQKYARQIRRAVAFVRKEQRPDGSWFGRWGTNYIYGTWQAISGLTALGVPTDDSAVVAGANWLLSRRQQDGGWGESQDSYRDPKLAGLGETTCSQTAWATLGLIAAGRADSPAVRAGIDYLLTRQRDDGSWRETPFTGTGFPLVYYLKYQYYPIYFPLTALGFYAEVRRRSPEKFCNEKTLVSNAEPIDAVAKPENLDRSGPTILNFEAARATFRNSRTPVEIRSKTPPLKIFCGANVGGDSADSADSADSQRSTSFAIRRPASDFQRREPFAPKIFGAEEPRPTLRVFTG